MTPGILGIALGLCVIPLLLFIAAQKLPLFRRRIEPDARLLVRLQELAARSLDSLDVPVGAVLLYDGTIIGEGSNTVIRENAAGGHAEINAITHAMTSMGYEKFAALDRSKLILLTTFEPCMMCAGACINNNIPTVYFLEPKNAGELFAERKLYARYLFRRMRLRNRGEQLALFHLHPGYPGKIAR